MKHRHVKKEFVNGKKLIQNIKQLHRRKIQNSIEIQIDKISVEKKWDEVID